MWTEILTAIVIVAMLVYFIPRARAAMKESPEADSSQWMSALIPIGLVMLFVFVLVKMV